MPKDEEILLDLCQALQKIMVFIENLNQAEFNNDEKTQSSVLYQIVIVGEAINRLSEEFKSQYPQIPFNEIRGMRNRVVHEYNEVDCDIIWEAIQYDIPPLLEIISSLISSDP